MEHRPTAVRSVLHRHQQQVPDKSQTTMRQLLTRMSVYSSWWMLWASPPSSSAFLRAVRSLPCMLKKMSRTQSTHHPRRPRLRWKMPLHNTAGASISTISCRECLRSTASVPAGPGCAAGVPCTTQPPSLHVWVPVPAGGRCCSAVSAPAGLGCAGGCACIVWGRQHSGTGARSLFLPQC